MITIELLSAPGCANCRAAKAMVARLIERERAQFPDLIVEEVDVIQRPEVALKYRVMSVPAIAINGELAFAGVPREEELRKQLSALFPSGGKR